MTYTLVQLTYVVATALFVFALHWMNTPATARRGVYAGVVGMALAVAATWAEPEVVHHLWIVIAVVAGLRGRHPTLPGAAHGGAPADRALPRVRRAGGRAGGDGQVLPLVRRGLGGAHGLPHHGDHPRGAARLPDVHRQPHGGGEAPGSEVDPAAAGDLPRTERHQHRPPGGRGRAGRGDRAAARPPRGRRWRSARSSRWRCSSAYCSSSPSAAPTCRP